jgi:anti-sigma factor RsiW
MDITEFDRDETLTDFLTDYIDGNLNRAERESFEDYLSQNDKERNFARKAMQGKKALSRLAEKYNPTGEKSNYSSEPAIDI